MTDLLSLCIYLFIYLFIYLCGYNLLPPIWSRRVVTPVKKIRKKGEVREKSEGKRTEAQRGKPLTPTRAIGALIRDEEQRLNRSEGGFRRREEEGMEIARLAVL